MSIPLCSPGGSPISPDNQVLRLGSGVPENEKPLAKFESGFLQILDRETGEYKAHSITTKTGEDAYPGMSLDRREAFVQKIIDGMKASSEKGDKKFFDLADSAKMTVSMGGPNVTFVRSDRDMYLELPYAETAKKTNSVAMPILKKAEWKPTSELDTTSATPKSHSLTHSRSESQPGTQAKKDGKRPDSRPPLGRSERLIGHPSLDHAGLHSALNPSEPMGEEDDEIDTSRSEAETPRNHPLPNEAERADRATPEPVENEGFKPLPLPSFTAIFGNSNQVNPKPPQEDPKAGDKAIDKDA